MVEEFDLGQWGREMLLTLQSLRYKIVLELGVRRINCCPQLGMDATWEKGLNRRDRVRLCLDPQAIVCLVAWQGSDSLRS
jgi:hypothetical protein